MNFRLCIFLKILTKTWSRHDPNCKLNKTKVSIWNFLSRLLRSKISQIRNFMVWNTFLPLLSLMFFLKETKNRIFLFSRSLSSDFLVEEIIVLSFIYKKLMKISFKNSQNKILLKNSSKLQMFFRNSLKFTINYSEFKISFIIPQHYFFLNLQS